MTTGKFRNLAVLGLLALVGATSGCIIESSSSPPPTCFDGAVAATWTLTSGGQVVSCAPGDEVDINVGSHTATFDCATYGGTTPTVPGGQSYSVSLGLFNGAGAPLSLTQTMSLFVRCGV